MLDKRESPTEPASPAAQFMAEVPWRSIHIPMPPSVQRLTPRVTEDVGLPNATLFSYQGFRLHGIGQTDITAQPITIDQIERPSAGTAGRETDKKPDRDVIFLRLDQALREEILTRRVSMFETPGIVPRDLAQVLEKLGIDEERFLRVVNLSPTERYSSERNCFHSFCIPEHTIVNTDLRAFQGNTGAAARHIFRTHMVYVVYNQRNTIVIHDDESPCVNQLIDNLANGRLDFFKPDDSLPDLTTLLKGVIEANTIAFQRVLRLFHKFKDQPFRAVDTALSAAFKMVSVEMQNYWITQESPRSGMEKLLEGIKADSASLGSLLKDRTRFQELIGQVQVATDRAQHLDRGVRLRDEARTQQVESRSQYISATLAALGSAFIPNATVTQLQISQPAALITAHAIASIASAKLLYRMYRAGWFDFVTETFGDLFGLSKVVSFFRRRNR